VDAATAQAKQIVDDAAAAAADATAKTAAEAAVAAAAAHAEAAAALAGSSRADLEGCPDGAARLHAQRRMLSDARRSASASPADCDCAPEVFGERDAARWAGDPTAIARDVLASGGYGGTASAFRTKNPRSSTLPEPSCVINRPENTIPFLSKRFEIRYQSPVCCASLKCA